MLRQIRKFRNGDIKNISTDNIVQTIRSIANIFKMVFANSSYYVKIDTPSNGKILFRIGDHGANGNRFLFDEDCETKVSVVIRRREFVHIPTYYPYTEITYPTESFNSNPKDILESIVAGVESLISCGAYSDNKGVSNTISYPQETKRKPKLSDFIRRRKKGFKPL